MPDITTAAAAESTTQRAADHIAGHPRILIIDDEAAIRESLETMLTLEGFSVTLATEGVSGMEQLARNQYDLLLLDLAPSR